MRDDMQQVTQWLADVEVGELTQAIEQEIIESLEELIAALEQELRELDENRPPPGQGQPGPPPEMALVNQLTELKLIRSQQERIYRRTKRYGGMIEGERAEASELLEALAELAERQQRIYRATKDLATGRND
jgi:Tfp pilus assembly protein PilN